MVFSPPFCLSASYLTDMDFPGDCLYRFHLLCKCLCSFTYLKVRDLQLKLFGPNFILYWLHSLYFKTCLWPGCCLPRWAAHSCCAHILHTPNSVCAVVNIARLFRIQSNILTYVLSMTEVGLLKPTELVRLSTEFFSFFFLLFLRLVNGFEMEPASMSIST